MGGGESTWKQQHPLQELVDEKNFKSYGDLKAKLYRVLNLTGDSPLSTNTAEDETDNDLDMSKFGKSVEAPTMKEETSTAQADTISDDDEDLAMFRDLVKG